MDNSYLRDILNCYDEDFFTKFEEEPSFNETHEDFLTKNKDKIVECEWEIIEDKEEEFMNIQNYISTGDSC